MHILQNAEGECLSLRVSLAVGLGGLFKRLSLQTGHLLKHWCGFAPMMHLGRKLLGGWVGGGRTKSGVWHKWSGGAGAKKSLPLRNFQRSSPGWKWSLRYKSFTPQLVATITLCQRNSQNQLLHVVSLDLPFYTQRPKTKQAVAWQRPGAAWHHSRSNALSSGCGQPQAQSEGEREEEEVAVAHGQCQASLLKQDLQVVG